MLAAKIFLAFLGLAYLGLAAWCIVKPADTARAIGYQLQPGSGQSEYLTVYGGLQIGLGLAFLLPLLSTSFLVPALLLSCLVHGSIVLCRLASLVLFAGISNTTFAFAGLEVVILVFSVLLAWQSGFSFHPL